MPDADVIVVGGGIVGCALATGLGGTGLRVLLLEREPPSPRFMGEYIHACGVESLQALGLVQPLLLAGALPIHFFQLSFTRRTVTLPIDPDRRRFGLAMTQMPLLQALHDHVRQVPGVELVYGKATGLLTTGSRVTGVLAEGTNGTTRPLGARFVVGADGRSSNVRRWAGISPRRRVRYYLLGGFAHAGGAIDPTVRVHIEDGRLYMLCPFANGDCRFLIETTGHDLPVLKQSPARLAEAAVTLLRRRFGLDLSLLPPPYPVAACPEIDLPTICIPGLVLAGDAAGVLNPLTASGMTAGLHDVGVLAPMLTEGLRDGQEPAPVQFRRYQRARRRFAAGLRLRIWNFSTQMWATRSDRLPHRGLRRLVERVYATLGDDLQAQQWIGTDLRGESDPLAFAHWMRLMLRVGRFGGIREESGA